jgi:PAT family beta-lactamase induction signal transducer AmpG
MGEESTVGRFFSQRMLICVVTGFTSGLPLFLLMNLLPAWLRSEGLSLALIGVFALIQFPYTWKFLWAPLLDRYSLGGWGRRRSWMLGGGVASFFLIGALGALAPAQQTFLVALVACALALSSATLDIALDAYRRELLPDTELGLGNVIHVNAYKIAGLIPGSLSLILADIWPWDRVFWVTAAFMLPGIFLALCVREPQKALPPTSLRAAVIAPWQEFIHRAGLRHAASILLFILFYKLGDSLCTALATPFYLDMGYSKTDIGWVAKHAGLWPSIAGGFIGGLCMLRIGIHCALWVFGVMQALPILGFAWLAAQGPFAGVGALERTYLALVIGCEALGVGLGTAAFVAFIARTSHPAYAATQIALFTSLMAVPRTFINAAAGQLVEWMGWAPFFVLCFALALPGFALLGMVAPWRAAQKKT